MEAADAATRGQRRQQQQRRRQRERLLARRRRAAAAARAAAAVGAAARPRMVDKAVQAYSVKVIIPFSQLKTVPVKVMKEHSELVARQLLKQAKENEASEGQQSSLASVADTISGITQPISAKQIIDALKKTDECKKLDIIRSICAIDSTKEVNQVVSKNRKFENTNSDNEDIMSQKDNLNNNVDNFQFEETENDQSSDESDIISVSSGKSTDFNDCETIEIRAVKRKKVKETDHELKDNEEVKINLDDVKEDLECKQIHLSSSSDDDVVINNKNKNTENKIYEKYATTRASNATNEINSTIRPIMQSLSETLEISDVNGNKLLQSSDLNINSTKVSIAKKKIKFKKRIKNTNKCVDFSIHDRQIAIMKRSKGPEIEHEKASSKNNMNKFHNDPEVNDLGLQAQVDIMKTSRNSPHTEMLLQTNSSAVARCDEEETSDIIDGEKRNAFLRITSNGLKNDIFHDDKSTTNKIIVPVDREGRKIHSGDNIAPYFVPQNNSEHIITSKYPSVIENKQPQPYSTDSITIKSNKKIDTNLEFSNMLLRSGIPKSQYGQIYTDSTDLKNADENLQARNVSSSLPSSPGPNVSQECLSTSDMSHTLCVNKNTDLSKVQEVSNKPKETNSEESTVQDAETTMISKFLNCVTANLQCSSVEFQNLHFVVPYKKTMSSHEGKKDESSKSHNTQEGACKQWTYSNPNPTACNLPVQPVELEAAKMASVKSYGQYQQNKDYSVRYNDRPPMALVREHPWIQPPAPLTPIPAAHSNNLNPNYPPWRGPSPHSTAQLYSVNKGKESKESGKVSRGRPRGSKQSPKKTNSKPPYVMNPFYGFPDNAPPVRPFEPNLAQNTMEQTAWDMSIRSIYNSNYPNQGK